MGISSFHSFRRWYWRSYGEPLVGSLMAPRGPRTVYRARTVPARLPSTWSSPSWLQTADVLHQRLRVSKARNPAALPHSEDALQESAREKRPVRGSSAVGTSRGEARCGTPAAAAAFRSRIVGGSLR